MVKVSGNPNPTNPTYPTNPTNPTNPTTKYRCEFGTLFCTYASEITPCTLIMGSVGLLSCCQWVT